MAALLVERIITCPCTDFWVLANDAPHEKAGEGVAWRQLAVFAASAYAEILA